MDSTLPREASPQALSSCYGNSSYKNLGGRASKEASPYRLPSNAWMGDQYCATIDARPANHLQDICEVMDPRHGSSVSSAINRD